MQPGEEVPDKPHGYAQRRARREGGALAADLVDDADVPAEVHPRLVVCGLDHAVGEVRVADEALLLVKGEPVAARDVGRQARGLDEDGGDPVVVGAHDVLGALQVRVHVGRGAEHDGAEPLGLGAREVVVEAAGAEEDQPGGLVWCGVRRLGLLVPQAVQGADDGDGRVCVEAAAGDVVVAGHREEDGLGAAQTVVHQRLVVHASSKDIDLFVVNDLWEDLAQLCFVSTIRVDVIVRGLFEEVADQR